MRGVVDHARATSDLPAGISSDWWGSAQRQIRQAEYRISQRDDAGADGRATHGPRTAYQAPNRAHGLRIFFTPDGIQVVPRTLPGEWQWGLNVGAYGRTAERGPAQVSVSRNRIEYRRGDLTQWYVNDERGLEQGFTLAAPPEPSTPGLQSSIAIEMTVAGGLHATVKGDVIDFATPDGAGVLRYGGLRAKDATGRELAATMELKDASLRLVVDASSAVYPVSVDPLVSSPNWTAAGNQKSAHFGTSVASAGDVNGDGYDDVIVGADGFDNGQFGAGRVFVYHGSASGLSLDAAFTAEGDQALETFGFAVNTAGDVNGDGYDDVVVGATGYDNGELNEGGVFVYHGSASGLISPAAFIAEGGQVKAFFGWATGTAGDVNGDGYDDLIVGAPNYNNREEDEGRVWVFHGSAFGLISPAAFAVDGNQSFAVFGYAVGTAGDVNGDGYDDVIVGAPAWDRPERPDGGRVVVYHGSPSGIALPLAFQEAGGQAWAQYGFAVNSAGDVNGDGYDDVIVGSPFYHNGDTDEGRVLVYHGSASGLVSPAAFTAESNQGKAWYGARAASAGDVDGDGYDDAIVGAPRYSNGQTEEGGIWLYRGSPSGLVGTAAFQAEGNQRYAGYGWSAGTAGDVNGDGFDDIIVGAPFYNIGQTDVGKADVYHGPLTSR